MNTFGVLPPDGSGDEPHELEESMNLSELFGALAAPGTADELARADTTVAAMVAAHAEAGEVVVPLRRVDRRPALVAVGSVIGVLGAVLVTGTAAAAFSGALPTDLQQIAHDVLGAPAPTTTGPDGASASDGSDGSTGGAGRGSSDGASEFTVSPGSNGSGPAATLDAAALFGLCQAFADNGPDDLNGESVAFRVLSEAASAKDQTIEEYCAPIMASRSGKPTASAGSTNKPTANPGSTKRPTVVPGSKPPTATPGSTRKPTVVPSEPGSRSSASLRVTRGPSVSAT